jgi:polysaccharide transporter, PST family
MKSIFLRLIDSNLVQNAMALYGVQLFRKIVPLITIPYLARILGPGGWGLVAFALSFASLLTVLLEFGFPLSATREVARSRHSQETCTRVVAGVVGLQIILLCAGIVTAVAAASLVPVLHAHPRLLISALLFAGAQGLAPFWFFQGMEQLKFAAILDVTGKVIGMFGLLIFVRSPADDWLVLVCQGVGPLITTAIGFWTMYKTVTFRLPARSDLVVAFRHGWSMFVYRVGTSLCSTANVFVLGLFAPVHIVGYYASAEKIASAVLGLLNPVQEALFPRLSSLARHEPSSASRLACIGALVMAAGGVVLGSVLFLFAPTIITILTGPQFAEAVPALRILALLLPLGALVNSVGLQWLLPFGRDGVVNAIILTTAAIDLALGVALAPRFGHIGMAVAAVVAEASLGLAMLAAVAKTSPFWRRTDNVPMFSAAGK